MEKRHPDPHIQPIFTNAAFIFDAHSLSSGYSYRENPHDLACWSLFRQSVSLTSIETNPSGV
jgi:hypothetical protein